MESYKLSIIILNYKSGGLTRECLRGLIAADLKLDHEIIVVDNNSEDNIGAILTKEFPQVKFIELEVNRGYAAGNNAGIKQAQGEYILILNPDITVFAGQIEKLVDFMENNPRVGLAGPRLVNPDGSLQYSCYKFPKFLLPLYRRTWLGETIKAQGELDEYMMKKWDHKNNRVVDWLLGACLITRRSALSEVGLLDTRYFLYVEDTDWCRRFAQKKWEVWYVAEVELVHFHERQSAEAPWLIALFSKIAWIHIASWLKYFWKWRKVS